MAKQKPDDYGSISDRYDFISGKMYKYRGQRFQYQGAFKNGDLQFSRFRDGEPIRMSPETARERFL